MKLACMVGSNTTQHPRTLWRQLVSVAFSVPTSLCACPRLQSPCLMVPPALSTRVPQAPIWLCRSVQALLALRLSSRLTVQQRTCPLRYQMVRRSGSLPIGIPKPWSIFAIPLHTSWLRPFWSCGLEQRSLVARPLRTAFTMTSNYRAVGVSPMKIFYASTKKCGRLSRQISPLSALNCR